MRSVATMLCFVAGLVSACGQGGSYADDERSPIATSPSSPASFESAAGNEEREPFDEDAARELAGDDVAGETYEGIGQPYGCTEDCSGHEAGFRYRAENGYVGHNADSPSFNEGGQAFEEAVEERVEEMRSRYEDGEDAPYE